MLEQLVQGYGDIGKQDVLREQKKFSLARAGTSWGGTGQRVRLSREAKRDRV